MVRGLALFFLALIVGAALGVGSALVVLRAGPALSGVSVGGWTGDFMVGSQQANPYTRAVTAARGLLALTREEAVYFNRTTDDQGAALSERCIYRVEASSMPAEWWSYTVYAADDFLPRNRDEALSFAKSRAEGAAAAFTLSARRTADGGAWVSTNGAGEAFTLMLRLYRPNPALLADPATTLSAPSVTRVSCVAGAA